MNAVSKPLGEHLKLCMCDLYDIFNMFLKIGTMHNEIIYFVDTKKEKIKHLM